MMSLVKARRWSLKGILLRVRRSKTFGVTVFEWVENLRPSVKSAKGVRGDMIVSRTVRLPVNRHPSIN